MKCGNFDGKNIVVLNDSRLSIVEIEAENGSIASQISDLDSNSGRYKNKPETEAKDLADELSATNFRLPITYRVTRLH